MAKKSNKSKSNKAKSDPTWDDATVDKHLKPTLAKKKIWWPDDARKKDLIALLRKHDVTLDEVLKGKKPRRYKRPTKPELEDDDSEEEEGGFSDQSSDGEPLARSKVKKKQEQKGKGKKQNEKQQEESDSSDQSSDGEPLARSKVKKKQEQKGKGKKQNKKQQEESDSSDQSSDKELAARDIVKKKQKQDQTEGAKKRDKKKNGKAAGKERVPPRQVELEQHELAMWSDNDINAILPGLANTPAEFKEKILAYSPVVKGNSPHSVAHFWFFADSIIRDYHDDEAKRNFALEHFAFNPALWTSWSRKLVEDPDLWFRWQNMLKLQQTTAKKFAEVREWTESRNTFAVPSSDGSNSSEEESSEDEPEQEDTDEGSAGRGDDSDDPFASDSDDNSDSDGDNDGKRVTYDSKKARAKRLRDGGKPADRITVDDPEKPGKKVKADIIGRHPSRKAWLVLALPSNSKKHSQLSRGYCVDGTQAKYNKAYERYLEEGSNRTLSTGSDVNLKQCAPSEFELNLVTTIPWGRNVHTHGYGIMHKKKGEFLMFSKQVLGKAWGSRDADDVLRDHMLKAGQSMPGREGKEIRAKSWGK